MLRAWPATGRIRSPLANLVGAERSTVGGLGVLSGTTIDPAS